ncbi:MAG TPA: hypothetical protein VGC57_01655, partial [Cellulomonas sp.]
MYWVRRVVVLVALVAVVALVVVGLKALTGGGGDAAETPTGGQSTAPATDPETTAADQGTPACDAATLGVTLAADATSYPSGALPVFTVTLVNNGADACLVDAGDAQRSLSITSGSDRIWVSTDCVAADAAPLQLLLGSGQSDERQVQWDRNRSAEGCPADQEAARPGTYQAVLTLAGVTT